jgi:hypothetical protein
VAFIIENQSKNGIKMTKTSFFAQCLRTTQNTAISLKAFHKESDRRVFRAISPFQKNGPFLWVASAFDIVPGTGLRTPAAAF